MLLYIALSYFNDWNSVRALPIMDAILPSHFSTSEGLHQRAAQSVLDSCLCKDTRTIWDIIWGCLATIFACSWVSIHPNIPAPNESSLTGGLRRIELMIWALIAPEIVIFWAVNQWSSARAVEEKYRDRGWTQVHGYFIQMGGLMLYEGDTPKGVLTLERFEKLLSEKKIAFPVILEEDIKDRSKGDGLAKALVLLQTTWFIMQCIARRVQNLNITELELLTVALAVLNGAMYMFWWNKPLNIGRGIPVYVEPTQESEVQIGRKVDNRDIPTTHDQISEPRETLSPTPVSSPTGLNAGHEPEHVQNPETQTNHVEDDASEAPGKTDKTDARTENEKPYNEGTQPRECHTNDSATPGIPSPQFRRRTYARRREDMIRREPLIGRYKWFICAPFVFVDHELVGMGMPPEDEEMRVPTFHASRLTNQPFVTGYSNRFYFTYATAIIFGGVHCAGWTFLFPSTAEKTIWRVSSIVITAFPALAAISTIISTIASPRKSRNNTSFFTRHPVIRILIYQGVFCAIVVYVIARFCLLAVALTSLRNLPAGAYDEVQWTTFIPHL